MPQRILVPLDRSHRSDAALAGLTEVCAPGDEITLLSVVKPAARAQVGTRQSRTASHLSDPAATARLAPGRDTPIFETQEQVRERQVVTLTGYLNAKADELQRRGFKVYIQPLVEKDPAKAIIDYARSYRPSAILMVRRTHDPRRFIFGSVSSEVAKADVAPLLLLPARAGDSQLSAS
jgi:nucleotide-binding universal stress UspA family protein